MKAAKVDRKVLDSEQRTRALLEELNQKQARTEEKLDKIMAALAVLTQQNQNLKLKVEEGDGTQGEGRIQAMRRENGGTTIAMSFQSSSA